MNIEHSLLGFVLGLAGLACLACGDSDDDTRGVGGAGGMGSGGKGGSSGSSTSSGGSAGLSSSSGGSAGSSASGGTGGAVGQITASCTAGDICIEGTIRESDLENFGSVCDEQQSGTVGSGCSRDGESGTCTYIDAAFGIAVDMIFYNLDAMGIEDSETFCGVLMGSWSIP